MYTIIGSGFGLYGYLPAIIKGLQGEVVLPERYLPKIRVRPELKDLEERILWVKNKELALQKATKLIVAVPPSIQSEVVRNSIESSKIKTVYLEKPVAPTPKDAIKFFEFFELNEINYVIGYSFLYLGLQSKFNILINSSSNISWNWNFMAHHFYMDLQNWKRSHKSGGGVLRFYGIHVIAFLSLFGYDNVVESTLTADKFDEPYVWEVKFIGEDLPPCHLRIDCKSEKNIFDISSIELGTVISAGDPFDLLVEQSSQLDRRIPMLASILKEERSNISARKRKYKNINILWEKAESLTTWKDQT